MAKENCPGCGEIKHVLNRCGTCGFQRSSKTFRTNLSSGTEPRAGISGLRAKTTSKNRKIIKSGRPSGPRKKKSIGGGSIMYGLIHKTSRREWHQVK